MKNDGEQIIVENFLEPMKGMNSHVQEFTANKKTSSSWPGGRLQITKTSRKAV